MRLILLLVLTIFISWLNSRLLAVMIPFWRARPARYAFLLLSAAAVLVLVSAWPRNPPFAFPSVNLNHAVLYAALAWLSGQLILLALQPLLYVAHRFNRTGKTPRRREGGPEGGGLPSRAERGAAGPGLTRRAFLARTMAAAPLAALGGGAQGIYGAQTELAVVRHTLAVPDLPANLDGFKIGQLSDTHMGPFVDLARLDYILGRLAAEKPDLVVMTGDFADDLSLVRPAAEALAALGATVPHGVYFCWGNHEYFRDVAFIRTTLERAGIKILKDASALVVPGRRPLYLLGADYPPADHGGRSFNISAVRRKECFAAAAAKVPPAAVGVLIAHHPDFLYDGFAARIPLTLTGHTHGGQVVIAGRPLLDFADYVRGLYRENGVYGYVSSGAGHWFPFRLGCPPEISVFTLTA